MTEPELARSISPTRAWTAVGALTLSVFVVTVTEMMPVGLLPQLSGSLDVSESMVGWSVAAYGLVAGLAAPPLTRWTSALDRRLLLLLIIAVFMIGNAVTASVTGITALLAVRIAIGTIHGLMWSIVAAVAVQLVPTRPAPATAVVFSGISTALVLGVPAGTWLGQNVGWRCAFLALAGLGAVCWAGLAIVMPALPPRRSRSRAPAIRAALLRRHPSLRVVLAVTALVVTGNYAAYTYVVPFVQASLGFTSSLVSPLLLVYGVAGVIGNLLAGVALNRASSSQPLILATLAALSLVLAVLPLLRGVPVLAVVSIAAWGLCYSSVPVMLQTRIFSITLDEREAATALYVLTFNTCIAAGAFIGGLALQQQAWLPIAIGAACSAVAAVLSSRSRDSQA